MSVCAVDWDKVVAATNDGRALQSSQQVGTGFNKAGEGNSARSLGLAFLGVRPDQVGVKPVEGAGYLLPFEIVSVHLLVVLIGAAYLARAKRRVGPPAQA